MPHQPEKPLAVEHVELDREQSATTDIAKAGPGALPTLARLRQGKADAAMEILQGERVEMTDEQVCCASLSPSWLTRLNIAIPIIRAA